MSNALLRQLKVPVFLSPMAGAGGVDLCVAVQNAGGLGSLPCATLTAEALREQVRAVRAANKSAPLNLNFFAHRMPSSAAQPDAQSAWLEKLAPYYEEYGLDTTLKVDAPLRLPFDEDMCSVVEALRPEVVSFHFGLPSDTLLDRVKASGALVMSSATTVAEAEYLEEKGVDMVIAQGFEAGGHRGMFLTSKIATQMGLFSLLPQIIARVKIPVIAAGGIADARGISAALSLGASAVQLGTAFLNCPESLISPLHRKVLSSNSASSTALTNLFSGRLARGMMNRLMLDLGAVAAVVPPFPYAGAALAPLQKAAEAEGQVSFSPLWAGQSAPLCQTVPAETLMHQFFEEMQKKIKS
jgi:nitronate monooxygenase